LVQGCEARNGGHSASHLYLKQVILICAYLSLNMDY
jgi:hypothetical protein